MATNYLWVVNSMSTIDASPNEPKFVVQVNYSVIATETISGKVYESKINDSAFFDVDPTQANYIPYANLTNAIVIGWVQEKLTPSGVENYESTLAAQIQAQVTPPPSPEPTPLPWVNN